MQAKKVLYAAVGAPAVAAQKVSDQVSALKEKIEEEKANYGKLTEETLEAWAAEGEKILARLKDGKVVERMDLDQAKEQVGKLRDQLEEMLETWRHSFRPEKAEEGETEEKAEVKTAKPAATTAKKPAAKKTTTTAKKPTAKKPAAKAGATKTKASAAKTTKSSTAAKTSSAKSPAAKATKAS